MHLSLNCCNCPRLQAFFTSANTNTHTQTHTYFYCRCSFLCFLADQIYVFALWSHVLLGDLVNPGRAGGRKQKSLWVGVGIWKGTDTHFTFMATQNHYNKALQTPNGKLAAGGQPPPALPSSFVFAVDYWIPGHPKNLAQPQINTHLCGCLWWLLCKHGEIRRKRNPLRLQRLNLLHKQ